MDAHFLEKGLERPPVAIYNPETLQALRSFSTQIEKELRSQQLWFPFPCNFVITKSRILAMMGCQKFVPHKSRAVS